MTGFRAGRIARGAAAVSLVWAGVGAAGCDQISSFFGGKDEAVATPGTAPVPAAMTRPAVPLTEVVATVNGAPIAKVDMEIRIEEAKVLSENLGQPWGGLTKDQLEAGLEEMVSSELMAQDAMTRGVDRDPQVQQRFDVARRQFFAQEWLRWNKDRLDVSSKDVEAFYEQNKIGFQIPEQRRLRQLVFNSEDQAKQALAQLLSGADAGSMGAKELPQWVMRANELAAAFPSQDEAAAAGVIALDPLLENAAFAIDRKDALSNHVKGSDNKFHIFQLVEVRAQRQRPMTEVWDQIKAFMILQKLQQAVDELRVKATIERFPERLSEIKQ